MSRRSVFVETSSSDDTLRYATCKPPPPLAYESNSLHVRQDLAAVRGLLPLVHAFLDVPWEVSRRQASLVDAATGGAFWEGPIRSPPQDPNADDRRSTRPTAQSETDPVGQSHRSRRRRPRQGWDPSAPSPRLGQTVGHSAEHACLGTALEIRPSRELIPLAMDKERREPEAAHLI